jgi:hypothetical protein
MADEPKNDDTLVGTVMKNGGGAATGAVIAGGVLGPIVAGVLAPFTGGLSLAIPPLMAVAGGIWGHKESQKIK